MKGLLTKDCLILRSQIKSLLLVLVCGTIMSFSFEPAVIIAYLTIVGAMTASGTIGYDEFDHGHSFLFTLPFERKTYVHEKYVFCIGFALVCMILGAGVASAIILFRGGSAEMFADIIPTGGMMFVMVILLMAMMIPIRVKYNSEKGKTVQFVIYGAMLVLTFGIGGLLEKTGVNVRAGLEAFFTSVNEYVLLAALLAVCLCILFVSVKISERIIEKKEY